MAGVFMLVLFSGLSIYIVSDLTEKVDDIFKNQVSGEVVFDTGGIPIGSGSIKLDPAVIGITENTSDEKRATALQAGSVLEVTVWIDSVDAVATVCDTGEEYGPFTVELDENLVPQSITPSSVTLTTDTLDLLNSGTFSLCVEVVAPVDGTVTIDSFTFNLGL